MENQNVSITISSIVARLADALTGIDVAGHPIEPGVRAVRRIESYWSITRFLRGQ